MLLECISSSLVCIFDCSFDLLISIKFLHLFKCFSDFAWCSMCDKPPPIVLYTLQIKQKNKLVSCGTSSNQHLYCSISNHFGWKVLHIFCEISSLFCNNKVFLILFLCPTESACLETYVELHDKFLLHIVQW